MCMDDYRIGRKLRTAASQYNINGVSMKLFLPENPSRVHISFANANNQITIAPTGSYTDTTGIYQVAPTLPPLEFDIQKHGDIVTKSWDAVAPGGPQGLLVIETFLADV